MQALPSTGDGQGKRDKLRATGNPVSPQRTPKTGSGPRQEPGESQGFPWKDCRTAMDRHESPRANGDIRTVL